MTLNDPHFSLKKMAFSILTPLLILTQTSTQAQTNVRAWYADGQVWVVWTTTMPLPETYAIYTSSTAFSNTAEATLIGRPFYLEYMPATLRNQVDDAQTYRIPDGMGGIYELAENEGLFVATPHESGAQFFAVTKWEDTIVLAENRTTEAVEIAYNPIDDPVECHLQKIFPSPFAPTYTCYAYTMWADGRQAHWQGRPDFPIMANAAKNGMPSLFIISVPDGLNTSEAVPLTVWLHGGRGEARQSIAGQREIVNINPELGVLLAHNDDLVGWRFSEPSLGPPSWHFGWRKNWDPFTQADFPTAVDTIINYTQRRYIWIDEWLVRNYNIDPDRININGHSMGAAGSTALAKCYPSHYASASIHSNGFHGPVTNQASIIFGPTAGDFPTNLVNRAGEHVRLTSLWNITDNCSPERDWPLMRTWHGKRDSNDAMAWDEEVVNNYRIADSLGMGVQIFWSERAHSMVSEFNDHWYYGSSENQQTVYDNTDYEEAHFRANSWLPAFFNHRLMPGIPDPGNGTSGVGAGSSGDDWGTWGGYHRWENLSVSDNGDGSIIQGTFWLEKGAVFDNDNCPVNFLDADLYIRRLPDYLSDFCNTSLTYTLTSLDDDYTRSGLVTCEEGNLMRLNDVRIFKKDIRRLQLEIKLTVAATSLNSSAFDVILYPNPVKDITQLSFHSEQASFFDIKLLTISGQVQRNWVFPCQAGINEQSLNFKGIPSGVYFLQLSNELGERRVLKLIR